MSHNKLSNMATVITFKSMYEEKLICYCSDFVCAPTNQDGRDKFESLCKKKSKHVRRNIDLLLF